MEREGLRAGIRRVVSGGSGGDYARGYRLEGSIDALYSSSDNAISDKV